MKITIKRHIRPFETKEAIIEGLLTDRNVTNRKEFFSPTHPRNIELSSFFDDKKSYLKKRNTVFNLLNEIRRSHQTVVVYTDYDADGLTGGAILWQTLAGLGFKVMPYVPDRKSEGYGFSKLGIDNIKKQFDPSLVISVDHGIVGHDAIAYAGRLGIPVIVTDHHTKDKTEPPALAVFHTNKLSGSAVAYFFAKEIYENYRQEIDGKELGNYFETDFVSLSAIGTVADLVPLTGVSRALVKHGLLSFSHLNNPGLSEMIKEAQITRPISTYELGYLIGPRINAFGRIDDPKEALRLLCTKKEARAFGLAQKAGRINKERQQMVDEAMIAAESQIDLDKKILIVSGAWSEGIIGLIAGKLTEKYSRPAIAIASGGKVAKASARSIPGFDITAFLRSFKSSLKSVGGHPAAAGFTIDKKKLETFTDAAVKKAEKLLTLDDLTKQLKVDLKLAFNQADLDLAEQLNTLLPFGVGNKNPLLLSEGSFSHFDRIGDGRHARVYIKDKTDKIYEIMLFGQADHVATFSQGKSVRVFYHLEVDTWNGVKRARRIGKYLL